MKLYEKVTRDNWIKGSVGNGDKHCLVGHIWDMRPLVNVRPLYDAIKMLYPERVGGIGGRTIAAFNDHPDTTFEDVQRVLKFADV